MKLWEKLIYAVCVLVGWALFQLWFFGIFIMKTTGGALVTIQMMLCGLASLLFFVPFLTAPIPGAVPLRKKWYGWALIGLMIILIGYAYSGYQP